MVSANNIKKTVRLILSISSIIIFSIIISISAIAQDAQSFYENGYQFFTEGEYQKAEESYRKAVDLDQNFEDAHYWLGKVYRQTGQYDKSIIQWIEVLRINPRNPYAFRYLNESYQSTPRVQSNDGMDFFNEAIEMLAISNEIFVDEKAYNAKALLQTVPYFRRAIQLNDDLTAAHYWLAEVYHSLSKKVSWQYTSMAINSFENAIEAEEEKNSNSFQKPSEYWHSYQELLLIFQSLGLNERKANLLQKLSETKKIPYKEVLIKGGYPDLDYPDEIEIFSDGEVVTELWKFTQDKITLRIVDKEIVGEEISDNVADDVIMIEENKAEGEDVDED